MKTESSGNRERLLAGIGLLAAVGSLVWFALARKEIRRVRAMPLATIQAGAACATAKSDDAIPPPRPRWSAPEGQAAGPGWRYELFAPPVVFYDAKSATFTVVSPKIEDRSGASMGPDFPGVKRKLFRVQLAGFFGPPDARVALLTQPGDSGVLRVASGDRLDALGLRMKNISVRRIAVTHPDAWPVFEMVASAEIFDERSGSTVILNNRQPAFADGAIATVNSPDSHPIRPATGFVRIAP